jgi:2-oxoglutarate ferredoxin oxidoreductase subunit alpha
MYTADGLEHNERGTPSSMASDHHAQLRKRRDKLSGHDYGSAWAQIDGSGEIAIVSWGSTSAVCREAADRLAKLDIPVRVISLRLLMPLNHRGITEVLQGCSSVVVIEQNQAGQLYHYLHAEQVLPPHTSSYAKPGPLPMRPGDVVKLISGVFSDE